MQRHTVSAALMAAVSAAVLSGCGFAAPGPSSPPARSGSPPASATPQVAGATRTVLTQLGLKIHADASTSAPVLGVAGQGAQLSVLDYQSGNGGWFKVQGATVTGWIVADATLSAPGSFTSYSSSVHQFSALYPSNWTFNEVPSGVVFRPQQNNPRTIVVRTGATTATFGQESTPGYTSVFDKQLIVCGYTGDLLEYQLATGAATPSPVTAGSPSLAYYAAIRLTFDSTHAVQLLYNYSTPKDLDLFADFYNSISFPFPLCQAPQPAPSPT